MAFFHPLIQVYSFEDVPLEQDIYLMDVKWMADFEAALVRSVDGTGETAYSIGYYSQAAAKAIRFDSIELDWYPNTENRFHRMRITLPRSDFITCVGSFEYDYKPVVFVRGEWLSNLHLRSHSVFALIDAIGVKSALLSGALTHSKLIKLRNKIDSIAAANPEVAFISFADSLLLKSNYSVGQYNNAIRYSYEPEKIVHLLPDVRDAYKSMLELNIYAVIAQGSNEYYDDALLHVSDTRNHISFNSLGLPFAQIQAIEHSARAASKAGKHVAADVYLDEDFYHSLRFKFQFAKNEEPKFIYAGPMKTGPSYYFPVSFQLLADNLVQTSSRSV